MHKHTREFDLELKKYMKKKLRETRKTRMINGIFQLLSFTLLIPKFSICAAQHDTLSTTSQERKKSFLFKKYSSGGDGTRLSVKHFEILHMQLMLLAQKAGN